MSVHFDDPTTRVQPDPAFRTLVLSSDELSTLVVDERTGARLTLNGSASAVWALLEEPTTVGTLTADLVELSSLDAAAADAVVRDALRTFWDHGLLVGSIASATSPGEGPDIGQPGMVLPASAGDSNPRQLPRDPDPCQSCVRGLGWAATVNLRVGSWRVGVRPDSRATRRRLESLFERFVEQVDGATPSNFSIRRGRRWRRTSNELYVGGVLIRRTEAFDGVLHILAGMLGGLAAAQTGPVRTRARVAACGSRAVLVKLPAGLLVDAFDGNRAEVATWDPIVRLDERRIDVPPTLDGLAWAQSGLRAPPERRSSFDLAGAVVPRDPTGAADLAALWLDSRGRLDEWGVLLTSMQAEGRVLAAADLDEARAAINGLLAGREPGPRHPGATV